MRLRHSRVKYRKNLMRKGVAQIMENIIIKSFIAKY